MTERASAAAQRAQGLFLVGAATLIAEILWARSLSVVLGSDVEGIAVAVALFLLGGAMGSVLAARTGHSARRWLIAGLVAAPVAHLWCGALLPGLADGRTGLEWLPLRVLAGAPVGVVALFLGAALPAWFRTPITDTDALGARAGRGIAALDLGAAAGAIATPLVLLPQLGDTVTFGVLLLVLGAAVVLAPHDSRGAPVRGVSRLRRPGARARTVLMATVGVLGFLQQVVWTRLLGEVLGSSLLVLGIAACALLVGGALGARLAPAAVRRLGALDVLLVAALAWVALQLLSAWVIAESPRWYLSAIGATGHAGARVLAVKALLIVGALLPPALAAGLFLPTLAAGWSPDPEHLATEAGDLQGALLVGGTAGSLLAGFLGIPWLGSGGTLAVAGIGSALVALSLVAVRVRVLRAWSVPVGGAGLLAVLAALAALLPGRWEGALLGAGVFQWAREDVAAGGVLGHWREREILYDGEGRLARVTIERAPAQNTVYLKVGGRVEGTVPITGGVQAAASLADMPTQLSLAVLSVLEGEPGPALVVGLGGGSTVSATVEARGGGAELTVLEVEEEVAHALRSPAGRQAFHWEVDRIFPAQGDGPRLVFEDARGYLLRNHTRYQAIICQPSEPWLPWSAPLFTGEFFDLVAARLEPGGVAVHWLQLHRIGEPEFAAILAAFRARFPRMQVYHPVLQDPASGARIATAEVLLVGGGVVREPGARQGLWDGERLRAVRERLGGWLPYPRPLLDGAGVDRWLATRRHGPRGLRGRLEFTLPLLADRGDDHSAALLASLQDAARGGVPVRTGNP